MDDQSIPDPVLPDHPELRDIALAMEAAGMIGELLDDHFRTVFLASGMIRLTGLTADEVKRQYGKSLIVRGMRKDSDIVRVEHESGTAWFFHNAPIMRRYLDPSDPDFDEIFGPTATIARDIEA